MQRHGPFGGLFGFSGGALVSSLVCEELAEEVAAREAQVTTAAASDAAQALQPSNRVSLCSKVCRRGCRTWTGPVPFLIAACAVDLHAIDRQAESPWALLPADRNYLGKSIRLQSPSLHSSGFKTRVDACLRHCARAEANRPCVMTWLTRNMRCRKDVTTTRNCRPFLAIF